MSRHVTYRGVTIDMDSMRRENEKIPAVGNASVNARGDEIKGGKVTKTADEIARERGRVQSVMVHTGLKGPVPSTETPVLETPKVARTPAAAKKTEKELPSGDIVIEGDSDVS